MTKMSHVYEPRKLPVILGLEEVIYLEPLGLLDTLVRKRSA
jgi:hypothetical protein